MKPDPGTIARIVGVAAMTILPVLAQDEAKPKGPQITPTYKAVPYGAHPKQVFNFWKAKSDKPTPVLVMIHGGGWLGGAMNDTIDEDNIFLSKGVSVASISYRLMGDAPFPAPVLDAARCVQFIRSKAAEWNLNKERFAYMGGSAGACTSLWLALHDDLADPKSTDSVARESTKPVCVLVSNAQTCIDPPVIRGWVGEAILKHPMISRTAGYSDADAMMKDYDKNKALYHEYSPIYHVDKNDPAIYMRSASPMTLPPASVSHAIHHPMHCVKLKERLDEVGVPNYLVAEGYEAKVSANDFVLNHLLNASPKRTAD